MSYADFCWWRSCYLRQCRGWYWGAIHSKRKYREALASLRYLYYSGNVK